jgi:hypothetical protein
VLLNLWFSALDCCFSPIASSDYLYGIFKLFFLACQKCLGMLLTPVSSTNQSNAHLIAEKLSKVVLSTHYTMQLSLLASKKEKFEDTIKVIR